MSKPKKCPKCGVMREEIENAYDLASLIGFQEDGMKEWFCARCGHNFDDEEVVNWYDGSNLSELKLSQIADIIFDDWKNISPNAHPYVEAMLI